MKNSKKEKVLIQIKEKHCTITLNNPEKHNRLDHEMIVQLIAAMDLLKMEKDMRVMVISGSGHQSFCSGFDFFSLPKTDKTVSVSPINPLGALMDKIESIPYPIISRINGSAYGGGVELLCTTDIRVSVDSALFALPPARIGIMYPPEGMRRFVSVLGQANTRYLFFTAKRIDSPTALNMGLIHQHVKTEEELDEVVEDLVDHIIHNAPMAVKGMKYQLNKMQESPQLSEEEMKKTIHMTTDCLKSKDYNRGLAAFIKREKPDFKGD